MWLLPLKITIISGALHYVLLIHFSQPYKVCEFCLLWLRELVLKLNTLPTAFWLQNLGFLSLQTFQIVSLYFIMDFRISTNFICLDKLRYMWCRRACADLSCRIQEDIEKMLGPQQPESDLWGRWQWRR